MLSHLILHPSEDQSHKLLLADVAIPVSIHFFEYPCDLVWVCAPSQKLLDLLEIYASTMIYVKVGKSFPQQILINNCSHVNPSHQEFSVINRAWGIDID